MTTPTARRTRNVLIAVALVVSLAACDFQKIAPSGAGPLRYRDEVFTDVTVTKDLTYGSAVGAGGATKTLKLDLYAPTGDALAKRPAIVWVHGGSFKSGSKASSELVDEAKAMAKRGYVNVSIDYRLDPNGCSASAPTGACLTAITWAKEDAQAAVRWLRRYASTYGVDPTRIAIGGSSAGAITALNVGYDEDNVGSSGNPGHSSTVRAAVSLSGARLLGTPEKGDAWALLFHGTKDVTVPYSWAQNTAKGLAEAGVTVNTTYWEGDGHVPYAKHRDEIITQTTNFLWWAMDLAHAAS
ncbi:MAG: alpha/beta hydrolase [Acidimicrobiales bacterium]|nr:alpha/beta hydrolase [Acidimicrobiales bacterium]